MPNRPLTPHKCHRRRPSQQKARLSTKMRIFAHEIIREAGVEGHDALQVLDLRARELDLQGLDVIL